MFETINAQRRDINQLVLIRQKSYNDLYRTNHFTIQLQNILTKIDSLTEIYEALKPKVSRMNASERKQYARLQNDIAIETRLLKSTSEAMDDNLKTLKQTGEIEHTISGNILGLKKTINKTLKKTELLLKSY